MTKKALLIGHFTTVGDTECLDYIKSKLDDHGIRWDVCSYFAKINPHLEGSIHGKDIDPNHYSFLIAICGPFRLELLSKIPLRIDQFSHCTKVGVNITLNDDERNGDFFDVLYERDSPNTGYPDLTFINPPVHNQVIVAGCFVKGQNEYGDNQLHEESQKLFEQFIESGNYTPLMLDTKWPKEKNQFSLQKPEDLIALMSKANVVITNRLHGLVLAIRSGTPAVAIDSIRGGAKVSKQAQTLGWPALIADENHRIEKLVDWAEWCQTSDAKDMILDIRSDMMSKVHVRYNDLIYSLNRVVKEE